MLHVRTGVHLKILGVHACNETSGLFLTYTGPFILQPGCSQFAKSCIHTLMLENASTKTNLANTSSEVRTVATFRRFYGAKWQPNNILTYRRPGSVAKQLRERASSLFHATSDMEKMRRPDPLENEKVRVS